MTEKETSTVPTPAVASDVSSAQDAGDKSLEGILDLPLTVSVELGRSRILIGELIKLHKGSVVELNKLAGEALEVLVNGKVLAKGEVVVVNEKFGVRLTDVVSHTQRIAQLGVK